MNHQLRRKDRGMDETGARELLERGEYGILSSCGLDGQPYGIPLSYCIIDNGIYFHSALEGHKLENLAGNGKVSFCVVGDTGLLPDKFATRYESVIVTGRATEVFGEEKLLGLKGLLLKYSADFVAEGMNYIAAKGADTRVFRVSMESMSGKSRR